MNRRSLFKLAAVAGAGGAGGVLYSSVEPYLLRHVNREVCLHHTAQHNLRILHISDLHIGNRQQLEFVTNSIQNGLARKPDLICLTGDFINRKIYNPDECRKLFMQLSRAAPTVACLGNHDGGKWVERIGGYKTPVRITALLSESRIIVLQNRNMTLRIKNQPIALIGLDDLKSGCMNIEQAFCNLLEAPDVPRLVLAHNPDTKDLLRNHAWDLMLSGHTHGGQVNIPQLGAPILPVEDRNYIRGLYSWNNRQLHISSGVGTSCGIRFNCPPEICTLTLKGTAS